MDEAAGLGAEVAAAEQEENPGAPRSCSSGFTEASSSSSTSSVHTSASSVTEWECGTKGAVVSSEGVKEKEKKKKEQDLLFLERIEKDVNVDVGEKDVEAGNGDGNDCDDKDSGKNNENETKTIITLKDKDKDKDQKENSTQDISPRKKLRLELQERRPSVFRVRKICRVGLNYKIPQDLRADVWQLLLGVETKDRFLLDDSIRDTAQDLDNQRVIRVDAKRTRADVKEFRKPEIETLVSKLLTFYCKRKSIKYKQGLNEVLAPFIILRQNPSLPDGTIFNLFYAFIEKFLPHTYVQEEFHALQCTFRLFRLLLLYHDPELCVVLDTHNVLPELYATPWFLTMFARNVPLKQLYQIWDMYLLEEDDGGAILNMYMATALMIENRKGLLATHPSDLPIFVSNVLGPSPPDSEKLKAELNIDCGVVSLVQDLDKMIERAREIGKSTPKSFAESFSKSVLFKRCPSFDLVESLEAQPCLFISAKQLVRLINSKSREEMLFRVVDCRRKEAFEEEHLIGSLHLDPDLLTLPEQLDVAMKALAERCATGDTGLKIHLILVGTSVPPSSAMSGEFQDSEEPRSLRSRANERIEKVDPDCTQFVLHCLQRNFSRVSCVDGGWEAVSHVANMEPIFEHGESIDQLIEGPLVRPKSSTIGSLGSLKEAIGLEIFAGGEGSECGDPVGRSRDSFEASAKSPSSIAGTTTAWVQRIGRSLGENRNFFASPGETSPATEQKEEEEKHKQVGGGAGEEEEANDKVASRSSSISSSASSPSPTTLPAAGSESSFFSRTRLASLVSGTNTSVTMGANSDSIVNSSSETAGSEKPRGNEKKEAQEQSDTSLLSKVTSRWAGFGISSLTSSSHSPSSSSSSSLSTNFNSTVSNNPDEGWFNLSNWMSSTKDLKMFDAKLFQHEEDCLFAVTKAEVLRLRVHQDRPNFARAEECYKIKDLSKITTKKSIENLVVFHFKKRGSGQVTKTKLILTEPRHCIELVKKRFTQSG